jgi:hypothetical protein
MGMITGLHRLVWSAGWTLVLGESCRRGCNLMDNDAVTVASDPTAEWWTTADVASYLGVHSTTVTNYRKRAQMPPPDATVGRTHMWRPARIVEWHQSRPRPGVGGRPPKRGDEPGK